MSDTPDRKPLWKAMDDAYGVEDTAEESYVAIILAIADWLEAMWTAQKQSPKIPMDFVEGLSIGMQIHREGTLNILRAEADRAKAEIE